LARRQSSSPSSAESGEIAFGVVAAVELGSSFTKDVIGNERLHAAHVRATAPAAARRKASRPKAAGL
jgi:hypothetical protein